MIERPTDLLRDLTVALMAAFTYFLCAWFGLFFVFGHEGAIEIRVCDSGPGVPAGIKDRLFTPFFTTKPSDLRMGLAAGCSTVERHRDRIWAAEENGPGASFHVVLPSAQRKMQNGD